VVGARDLAVQVVVVEMMVVAVVGPRDHALQAVVVEMMVV
jgi:hypothetical protein